MRFRVDVWRLYRALGRRFDLPRPQFQHIVNDTHISDALIEDSWTKLPISWTNWWNSKEVQLVQEDLIQGSPLLNVSRPSSLASFLKTNRQLALPRDLYQAEACKSITLQSSKPVTVKKKHELSLLVPAITSMLRDRNDIDMIVDIGAGAGHLLQSLSTELQNYDLIGIDSAVTTSERCEMNTNRLQFFQHRLTMPILPLQIEAKPYMLTGLHCCGVLTDLILQMYLRDPNARALCLVGCCYNHIKLSSTHGTDTLTSIDFPTSVRFREAGIRLSPTAMATACLAPQLWSKQNSARGTHGLRKFYRAVLQKILFDKGIVHSRQRLLISGIRQCHLTSFKSYVHRSLECLNLPQDSVSDELIHRYLKKHEIDRDRITILSTLTSLTSAIIES